MTYSFDIEAFRKEQEEKRAKRKVMQDNPNKVGEVYFHISNSGVTFSVVDEGWGPTIVISGSSFGNMQSQLKLHVDNGGLEDLSKMFEVASKHTFSDEYVHKAESRMEPSVQTGQNDGD